MTKEKKNVKRLKRISLYPLSMEEALEALLSTPPPKQDHKQAMGKKHTKANRKKLPNSL
jgi:hypothetical protein